jgi:hypothetical protein
VLPGLGHISSFFTEQPGAGTRLINTYFASGRVDDSLYQTPRVDFTPATTLTALGKILAGTMVFLAFVTVLSLLWQDTAVQQRASRT